MFEGMAEWGLTYLAKAGYWSILTPLDQGYPRVTHLFYSTFRYHHADGAGPSYCRVIIDGRSFRIGQADIVATLDIPTTDFVNHIPCEHTEIIIYNMCGDQYRSVISTRWSYLPESLWIVDHIFY